MSTALSHSSSAKKLKSAYSLRSAKGLKQSSHTHRTHCTYQAFYSYTLRSRKQSCSCQFCAPEASVGSNKVPVSASKKVFSRNFFQEDERTARMQGYESFQRFMSERQRPADRMEEINSVIELVEAMDCTEVQKMMGGMDLRDDSTRAIFNNWPYERKLLWIMSFGNLVWPPRRA